MELEKRPAEHFSNVMKHFYVLPDRHDREPKSTEAISDSVKPNLVRLPQTPQKSSPESESRHLFAPKLHYAISDPLKQNLVGLPQTPQKSTPKPQSRHLFAPKLRLTISNPIWWACHRHHRKALQNFNLDTCLLPSCIKPFLTLSNPI